jgi:hypothetical protein
LPVNSASPERAERVDTRATYSFERVTSARRRGAHRPHPLDTTLQNHHGERLRRVRKTPSISHRHSRPGHGTYPDQGRSRRPHPGALGADPRAASRSDQPTPPPEDPDVDRPSRVHAGAPPRSPPPRCNVPARKPVRDRFWSRSSKTAMAKHWCAYPTEILSRPVDEQVSGGLVGGWRVVEFPG